MAARIIVNGQTLAGIRHFRQLTAEQRDALARRCLARRFRKDELIVSHLTPGRDVYFIVSGAVRITHYATSGRETVFRVQGSGACFGELAAIDGQGRSVDVVAIEETLLLQMSEPVFRGVLREHYEVTEEVLKNLTGLVRGLSQRVVEFSTLKVNNRVQAEVLRIAQASGSASNVVFVQSPPTHAEIAARIGTHREAVTRELGRLQKSGLMRCTRAGWSIRDCNGLRTTLAAAECG